MRLFEVIRALQRRLASHVAQDTLPVGADDIDVFVASLSTASTSGDDSYEDEAVR